MDYALGKELELIHQKLDLVLESLDKLEKEKKK